MTTLQKIVITATLAVVAGVGIYEARQASQLREQVQTLEQEQVPLMEQIQKLQRERDEAANRLSALADEIQKVKGSSSELLRLRGEVSRLRRIEQESLSDPIETAAKSWKNRVTQLKQRLEQTPNWKIPELQLVSEMDWLNAARNELRTDDEFRHALAQLRASGKREFANQTTRALDSYAKANNGLFPTDPIKLKPFFKPPVDEEILQRYEVVASDSLMTSLGDKFLLAEKFAVDIDHDSRLIIGQSGFETPNFGPVNFELLRPVVLAYSEANPGIDEPSDPSLLLPYATTRREQSAINLLTKAVESYKKDYNGQAPQEDSDLSPYLAPSKRRTP